MGTLWEHHKQEISRVRRNVLTFQDLTTVVISLLLVQHPESDQKISSGQQVVVADSNAGLGLASMHCHAPRGIGICEDEIHYTADGSISSSRLGQGEDKPKLTFRIPARFEC